MRDVAIVAAAMTEFGELWSLSLRDLFVEAASATLRAAKVETVDSILVGNMSAGQFVGQEHVGPLFTDHLGLAGVPCTRVESACASGGAALRQAYLEVASGLSDLVLAAGVEKMNDGADVTEVLATAADQETEVYHGVTFPGLYALIARAHMEKYGTTEEDLAAVAVKNHHNGAMNTRAQFRREVSAEQVMASTMVADPLRLLHCSPVSDGAAALLLCPLDQAKKYTDRPIKILGSGMATAPMALADREDPAWLGAVQASAERAYDLAGVGPGDVDVVEVHDCFAIAEICCIEALGLVDRGRGGDATRSGMQLRGESGDRQVKNARIGMTQNMGGSGASSVVHLFGRV